MYNQFGNSYSVHHVTDSLVHDGKLNKPVLIVQRFIDIYQAYQSKHKLLAGAIEFDAATNSIKVSDKLSGFRGWMVINNVNHSTRFVESSKDTTFTSLLEKLLRYDDEDLHSQMLMPIADPSTDPLIYPVPAHLQHPMGYQHQYQAGYRSGADFINRHYRHYEDIATFQPKYYCHLQNYTREMPNSSFPLACPPYATHQMAAQANKLSVYKSLGEDGNDLLLELEDKRSIAHFFEMLQFFHKGLERTAPPEGNTLAAVEETTVEWMLEQKANNAFAPSPL